MPVPNIRWRSSRATTARARDLAGPRRPRGRARRARSITSSPKSRSPRATTRPACGATAPSFRSSRNDASPTGFRAALGAAVRATLLAGDDCRADVAGAAPPAAVLVAVTDRRRAGVILTVRRETMRTHAGQVAFPGGRIDPAMTPSPPPCARPRRRSASIPPRVARHRHRRSLSDHHRLRRHPGARRGPARPRPRAASERGRRLVRGAARLPARPRQSAAPDGPVPRAASATITRSTGTGGDLGGDRGDDRQPVAARSR